MNAIHQGEFTCSPQQIQLAATSSRAAPTSFVRVEIEGALAVDAVEFAVRSLVERHESLRTRLVQIDGLTLPVQRVLPPGAPLAVNLDTASQATSDATASDRADGVPLEVSVLRRGSALCEVEIVAHAAHADCTSLGTVVKELFALLTGEQLGELPLQYPDITEWLCAQRSTDRAARLAAEWQEGGRLLARTQVLALEGRGDTDDPLRREIVLPRARLTALRQLGGGRADAAVLGCLAVLAARLARRDTVVIGVASSDRGLDELLDVVGAFEGMLPACIPVEGNATLADCCRPQAALLDRLVDEQFEGAWPRAEDLRDGVVYPITYRYLHLPKERCAGSLVMRVLGLGASRGDARLHVGCTEGSDDLRVALDFDPERFCHAAADEIAAQLKALLHAAEHPDAVLSDLAVSPICLADGPVAADVHATPLAHHLFEDFAARHPDAPAVTADGLAWSYARLDAEADAVAARLGVAGARAGDVVGVCLRPGLVFAAALLGVLKAGCVYLPLEPSFAAARMAILLEDARPLCVLTAAGLLPALPAAQRIELDPAGMPAHSRAARAVARDPGHPSRPAYVIYTSGSTGTPKGVVVSHGALVQYVRGLLARLGLPAGSTFASLSGIGADLGHTSLFGALLGGGHLHLVPDTEQIDAEALKARFAASPVDCLKIVPSHLAALFAGPDAAALLPRRALIFGGEALPRSLVERVTTMRPGCRVWNHYGPTETTVGALMLDVAAEDDGLAATVPIGFALDGYLVRVVDEQLRPVVDGTVGELLIGGAAVASGYLGQPALTAERFLTLPLGIAYRTGDLVRRRGNGSIEYLGRNDDQVKIRGYRVEPGEVRGALLAQPDVVDAYVGPLEGPAGDAILVAWIVPRAGVRPSASVLRTFLEGRLAGPMIPSEFVACEALPLLANGKVDRKALAARRGNAREGARYQVPRPGLETQIAELWAPLLSRDSIGRGDDFFQLGGHSLLAARVVSRMRSHFGLDVTLRTLFEHPTVETLAVALAGIAPATAATPAVAPLRRADMGQPQPLSYSQQRLWVLAQIEEHGSLYNIPAALRLNGPIDAQALQRALDMVVRRQASLRTRFFDTPDGPRQQVMDEVRIEVQIRDVEREAVAAEIERHAGTQFDLGEAGLLRIALLRLAPLEHVLLICLHHIVSDGWSSGILIRELGAFYDTLTGGASTLPPALGHHYLDFAVWQRQAGDAGIAQDLEAQVSHLQGAPALLELPTDFPRPPTQSFRGATVPVHVPRPVLTGLIDLARRNGATLFMVLSAALRVLLARYSSQDDISIGTPVANRSRVETEGLIGCFINTVVMRRRIAWEVPFIEELASERDVVLQALAADSVPFERLVERLAPQRTLAQSPLFQVMLILQNAPSEAVRLRGVAIEALDIPHPPAKFDLTFDLKETADGLKGRLEFARDLFRSETASDLVRRLGLLLSHVAADGAVATCDLQVIDPGERERMLHAWNPPFTQVPEPRLLHAQFEAQAARTPARTALYLDGRGITYGELARACDEFAAHLHATGPVAGGVIGICLERGFDAIVATIATLKVGAAFVPMDPALPAQRLAWMAEDSGVDIVVAARASRERLPTDVRCLVLEDLPPRAAHRVAGPSSASDASVAYILFTSGSTGRPKGVMVEHRNVANFFVGMDALMPEPAQTWLAATSQSFDISILELLWTLCRGHTTVVWRDDESATAHAHAQRPMDFSLFYFATDSGEVGADKYRLLLEGARFADDRGFSAVWTPERHFGGFGGLYPNPAITGAAISTITRRIGIRSGSLVLPLHNAVRVAEDWSVIDNLSGGRVGLSFATGWQPHDFALAPANYARRKEVMREQIENVRALWRGESLRMPAGNGVEIDVAVAPRPLQRELPFWITAAANPETFRLAGEIGANVLTHLLGQSVDVLAERIAEYRTALGRAGHAGPGKVSLMLHTFVADTPARAIELAREPFKAYLRGAIELVAPLARERGLEAAQLAPEDLEALLDHAADRYMGSSGLFGDVASCLQLVDRLKGVGVDEIACLIDFGIGTQHVLDHLPHLDRLRRAAEPATQGAGGSLEELIVRHGVSHFQCTPTRARLLTQSDSGRAALGQLRRLLVGGEALSAELAQRLRESVRELVNMYGPTETTIWSTCGVVDGETVTLGRPIANTRLYVVDPRDRLQPPGWPGELLIGGAGVARGYVKDTAATARRFVQDTFGGDGRTYRTGDLVRWLSDGRLAYLRRLDDQVKIRGFRIEIGELEVAIARHPTVLECAVVVQRRPGDEARLVAFVVMHEGERFEAEALRTCAAQTVPDYAIPSLLVPLAALPRTVGGKVDRKALQELQAQVQTREPTLPRSDVERALQELWSSLLKADIGIHDNFFSSGGDSIISIQMVSQARRRGLVLSPRLLFQNQTIAELAPHVGVVGAETERVRERDGEVPLTPIQHWFLESVPTDTHHYHQALLFGVSTEVSTAMLQRALDHVTAPNDALHLRFMTDAGATRQVLEVGLQAAELIEVDHMGLDSASHESAVDTLARELASSCDLRRGPLLRAALIRTGGSQELLVLAHHLVIDGVSWRTLMADLERALDELCAGRDLTAVEAATSYATWARLLKQEANRPRSDDPVGAWERLVGKSTPVLPVDGDGPNTEGLAQLVTVWLDAENTQRLATHAHRAYDISVGDALLAALVQALGEWADVDALQFDIESHGRDAADSDLDVTRSIGWFTALFPVRIARPAAGGPGALLAAVKESLRALPERGQSFGPLRYLHDDAEVRRRMRQLPVSPVVFNYLGQADRALATDARLNLLRTSLPGLHSPQQARQYLLNVNAIIVEGRLRIDITFGPRVHRRDSIDRLAARLGLCLAEISVHCAGAQKRFTPSDFPLLEIDQQGLDDVMEELSRLAIKP